MKEERMMKTHYLDFMWIDMDKILKVAPKYNIRKSKLDDIPDNFEERMNKMSLAEAKKKEKDAQTPEGFVVTVNYNKGGYQVVPKEDIKGG